VATDEKKEDEEGEEEMLQTRLEDLMKMLHWSWS